MSEAEKPRVVITYCRQCQWLLRAAWMAQELLSTFAEDLGEVTLRPGIGGVFRIEYQGELIWERKRDGGFPDVKRLKQIVRDRLDPARDLGHLDRPQPAQDDAAD
jgi:selenoprotein W-related protein